MFDTNANQKTKGEATMRYTMTAVLTLGSFLVSGPTLADDAMKKEHNEWKAEHATWAEQHRGATADHERAAQAIAKLQKIVEQHLRDIERHDAEILAHDKEILAHEKIMESGPAKPGVVAAHEDLRKKHANLGAQHAAEMKRHQQVMEIVDRIEALDGAGKPAGSQH
jgi:hypothetical protein